MPNFINRQEAADYDYDVNRWRQAAEKYNANITTYNKQVDAYNARMKTVPTVVRPLGRGNAFLLSDGRTVAGNFSVGQTYGAPAVATPNKALLDNKPDEKDKPVAPSFTTQQLADMGKSDNPMVDAAMAESKRSPMNNLPGRSDGETGLISRALKGFK